MFSYDMNKGRRLLCTYGSPPPMLGGVIYTSLSLSLSLCVFVAKCDGLQARRGGGGGGGASSVQPVNRHREDETQPTTSQAWPLAWRVCTRLLWSASGRAKISSSASGHVDFFFVVIFFSWCGKISLLVGRQ